MFIDIIFNESIERYSILVDGEVIFECLAEDEVKEIVKENLKALTKKGVSLK